MSVKKYFTWSYWYDRNLDKQSKSHGNWSLAIFFYIGAYFLIFDLDLQMIDRYGVGLSFMVFSLLSAVGSIDASVTKLYQDYRMKSTTQGDKH